MEENVSDVRKMFDEDKRVTYRQIEETLDLNTSANYLIPKDRLHVTKL